MKTAGAPLGRFFKHSMVYAFGNMLNRVAVLLLLPIYTNYLTVTEYGTLELFYIVSTVVTGLLSVGIAHATLRFYFEYDTEPERNAVVTTNLTVSFLIALVGVVLVGPWHEQIAHSIMGGPEYSRGVLIILATLVFELSSQVCLAYLRAKEYSKFFVGLMLFKLIIQFAANTYFVVFQKMGVEGVLTGNLLAVVFGWLALAVFVLRQCGYQFEWRKAVPVLKYSFPFLLSTIAGLISANVDRFLINSLLSLQLLGIYALALKFSSLLDNLIGEPFNRSYGAFRFSVMKEGDTAALQARIVRYLFIGIAAAGLGIVYFTRDLLVIMSAPAYWPAADILPVLMVGAVLKVMIYPMQTGILYEKKTRHIFHIGAISAVTSSVVNLMLITWFGLIGACLAQVLTAAVVLVITNLISQRYFQAHYEYGRLLLVSAVTVTFYLLSLPFVNQPMLVGIPLKLLLYVTFVVVLIYSGALHKTEIEWLRSTLSGAILRRRNS